MSVSILEKVAIEIGGLQGDYCNPCTNKKIVKCKECLEAAKRAIGALRDLPDEYFILKADKLIWQYTIDKIGFKIATKC